ncbi:hypothetical protein E3N88_12986 [Mikania micrantha]|uniref:Reverse transcriptase zinc-binding domain-containing protein n=1 Tax=Mikania micrantha TaxID=192012 RepID=A0A5N6P9K3_9ASTR|nr:hypothetical protein E3N88_12986 [Mikania micrantha]
MKPVASGEISVVAGGGTDREWLTSAVAGGDPIRRVRRKMRRWRRLKVAWRLPELSEVRPEMGEGGPEHGFIQKAVWCIWKARNDVMFNQRKVLKEKIVEDIKTLSYFWVKHRMQSYGLEWALWLSFDVGLDSAFQLCLAKWAGLVGLGNGSEWVRVKMGAG